MNRSPPGGSSFQHLDFGLPVASLALAALLSAPYSSGTSRSQTRF